jgi:predicted dehydrogenase
MGIGNSDATTRRTFLTALSAASYTRIAGANDRVQVGFIGYGLIGSEHVRDFKNQHDTDLAALSDVYQPRLEQGVAACGGRAKAYSDFRRLLDDKDIQAVVISTPDHWHALMTIMACAAGKDVYVEKPLNLFIREGQWMVEAARRYQRVVQVGTQQRSGRHYQKAVEMLRAGYIGKVTSARMGSFRNVMPGFGAPADSAPPNDLDYEMWLGPAPKRPYNPHRSLYHFRWFWDYSGGQMTNLGAHEIDIVQWAMQVKGPQAVSSSGGRLALEDNGETPDTQDALLEYPGFTAVFSMREASAGHRGEGRLDFFGTKGSLALDRSAFEVFPDMKIDPSNAIPQFNGQPAGGPKHSSVQPELWIQPYKMAGSSQEQLDLHARNFLDCVKSREQPIAGIQQGHQVTTACHLANISLRIGRKIRWNPEAEEIINDPQASEWLERPYRKPWDEVLRSFHL